MGRPSTRIVALKEAEPKVWFPYRPCSTMRTAPVILRKNPRTLPECERRFHGKHLVQIWEVGTILKFTFTYCITVLSFCTSECEPLNHFAIYIYWKPTNSNVSWTAHPTLRQDTDWDLLCPISMASLILFLLKFLQFLLGVSKDSWNFNQRFLSMPPITLSKISGAHRRFLF